nr:immunoglobulin heavy chain junction region [Mus musculus]MBK4197671.1 immunoglobulin heavy chain junction region [Mus musculus]MBK4197672.1 immunoglobulin heavy chain junction region [Mus musculus]
CARSLDGYYRYAMDYW